jgi:hypothetical protein
LREKSKFWTRRKCCRRGCGERVRLGKRVEEEEVKEKKAKKDW